MHHHLKCLGSSQRQGELCIVYHKTITDVNTTNSHFAFKTSLAIFEKEIMLANSNDVILKTDLSSLKCDETSFKMS